MANAINTAGLNLVKTFEGLRLQAYQDQVGVWTIGYGHTGPDVYDGLRISIGEADDLLRQDMADAESAVRTAVADHPTTDNQFAAMVSLCFNIGPGGARSGFRQSTVLKFHNSGAFDKAGEAFLLWNKVHRDGALVVSDGLARRRRAEQTLYLSPDDVAAIVA